jgi:hypothetical protein
MHYATFLRLILSAALRAAFWKPLRGAYAVLGFSLLAFETWASWRVLTQVGVFSNDPALASLLGAAIVASWTVINVAVLLTVLIVFLAPYLVWRDAETRIAIQDQIGSPDLIPLGQAIERIRRTGKPYCELEAELNDLFRRGRLWLGGSRRVAGVVPTTMWERIGPAHFRNGCFLWPGGLGQLVIGRYVPVKEGRMVDYVYSGLFVRVREIDAVFFSQRR